MHMFKGLSRFLDAANVKACLNENYAYLRASGDAPDALGGSVIGFRKTELLEKLLGSMK